MTETSPKRMKVDGWVANDPFVSFFLGEDGKPKEVKGEDEKRDIESTSLSVEKELTVPPIDDTVVEVIDPTIGESTIPATGYAIVDGVRIKLVEPKEEVEDEFEAAEGEKRNEIGQALQGVLESIGSESTTTLRDLLAQTMSDTSVTDKADIAPTACEKEVYVIEDSDEDVEQEGDGPPTNKKLYTPKFINYSIKCNLCPIFSNHPLAHMWFHFPEQPRYQCAHCSMAAGLVEDVAAHMKTVHQSVLVRPIDKINEMRKALWSYQAHRCFPNNFKREPEPENPKCGYAECLCGAVVDKEDPLLFNHIVQYHADDGLNYDDPEGTKHRYFFDLDGSLHKKMREMENINIESAKCEALRVRKRKSLPMAKKFEEEESDDEEQEMDSEESEEDEEEEEELEEGEVEEEEEDDSDGLE